MSSCLKSPHWRFLSSLPSHLSCQPWGHWQDLWNGVTTRGLGPLPRNRERLINEGMYSLHPTLFFPLEKTWVFIPEERKRPLFSLSLDKAEQRKRVWRELLRAERAGGGERLALPMGGGIGGTRSI